MCRHSVVLGNLLMALGAALLLSLLVPRSFWTLLIGVVLLLLGWLLGQRRC